MIAQKLNMSSVLVLPFYVHACVDAIVHFFLEAIEHYKVTMLKYT